MPTFTRAVFCSASPVTTALLPLSRTAVRVAVALTSPDVRALAPGWLDLGRGERAVDVNADPEVPPDGAWYPLHLDGEPTAYRFYLRDRAMRHLTYQAAAERDATIVGRLDVDAPSQQDLRWCYLAPPDLPEGARLCRWAGGFDSGEPREYPYHCQYPWPFDVSIQGTTHDRKSPWSTDGQMVRTFSVSLPALHTCLVTKGATAADAETKAWRAYQRVLACPHRYAYDPTRRDGWGRCTGCGITGLFLEPLDRCATCGVPARHGHDIHGQVYCEPHYEALPDALLEPFEVQFRQEMREAARAEAERIAFQDAKASGLRSMRDAIEGRH